MLRRCPTCRSYQVHRSNFQEGRGAVLGVLSPYRCEKCGIRFRVLSKKFCTVFAVVFSALIGSSVLWLIGGSVLNSDQAYTSQRKGK